LTRADGTIFGAARFGNGPDSPPAPTQLQLRYRVRAHPHDRVLPEHDAYPLGLRLVDPERQEPVLARPNSALIRAAGLDRTDASFGETECQALLRRLAQRAARSSLFVPTQQITPDSVAVVGAD
jgi:hypothetical protein